MTGRIRNWGISIGSLPTGPANAITDVPGVRVGHCTLAEGPVQTGVTAVVPCPDSPFDRKLPAGCHIINGFGKTTGLMQLEELGTLETPILLTNTLSVGMAFDTLVRRMLQDHPDIGGSLGTVNPVIAECNDGYLNDIRGMHLKPVHVLQALDSAGSRCAEGAVGAGRGMSCFGLKGGIGTSSRVMDFSGDRYLLGALVLANFGSLPHLTVAGDPLGSRIPPDAPQEEKGSIIIILATDLPLSAHDLRRVARRAVIGLSRTGGLMGNGSGEVSIAFSTANRMPMRQEEALFALSTLHPSQIDTVFQATAEAVEEAVLNALAAAEEVTGYRGRRRRALHAFLGPKNV